MTPEKPAPPCTPAPTMRRVVLALLSLAALVDPAAASSQECGEDPSGFTIVPDVESLGLTGDDLDGRPPRLLARAPEAEVRALLRDHFLPHAVSKRTPAEAGLDYFTAVTPNDSADAYMFFPFRNPRAGWLEEAARRGWVDHPGWRGAYHDPGASAALMKPSVFCPRQSDRAYMIGPAADSRRDLLPRSETPVWVDAVRAALRTEEVQRTGFSACRLTGAAAHADQSDNALTQLMGSKRVYVIPPRDVHDGLSLATTGHPFHRQSQLRPLDGFFNATGRIEMGRAFPRSRKIKVLSFLLNPGDVLFIPAFWGHVLLSEKGPSVGMATRPARGTLEGLTERANSYPLPFDSFWSARKTLEGYQKLVKAALTSVQGRFDVDDCRRFAERWRASFPHVPEDDALLASSASSRGAHEFPANFDERVHELAHAVSQLILASEPGSRSTRRILMDFYLDDVAQTLFSQLEAAVLLPTATCA